MTSGKIFLCRVIYYYRFISESKEECLVIYRDISFENNMKIYVLYVESNIGC